MTIMLTYAYIVIAVLGLILGSFAGASVWRLRARQLVRDAVDLKDLTRKKKSATGLTSDEQAAYEYLCDSAKQGSHELDRLRTLASTSVRDDRSRCLECGHELHWYDLLPLVSWVSTKGKCRYCSKRIGLFEPAMEIGTATVFVLFSYGWLSMFGLQPIALILLALWLVALTMFAILFAYDLKWYLLPDSVMFPLIGVSIVISGLTSIAIRGIDLPMQLMSIAASVLILGGLYFALWFLSRGQWVGFGDVKLGVALGILLMDWKLALLTLFLANLIGTLVVLPGLLTRKLSRKTQVPFGPFLIIGFFISLVFGPMILNQYAAFSTWLTSVMLML